MINKSFHILRTNPALTTNIKVIVTSKYELFLESIESDQFLNQNRFKRFPLNKDNLLSIAIPDFFKNVPEDIAFSVRFDNDQDIMYKTFDRQIDPIYFTGSRTVVDKRHEEEFEYFAPLHVNPNNIPSNFIIFRLDGPGRIDLDPSNFNEEVLDKLKVVSLFDMETTNLGRFMDNNFKNKYFPKSPLELDFREFEFSKWNGIDYLSGGYSSKSFFLNDTFKYELPFFEFDKFITEGYKKNSVIYPNIINLTFLFDDTPATPEKLNKYSINRYLGFYLDSLDLIASVTPFKTYQLITGGEISNNTFYDSTLASSYDPIEGGWKSDKEYFVWNNGKFHYLTRTLVGTNQYDYKIISDTIFDTNTNPLHVTDLFNTSNTQQYTVVTTYNEIKLRTELTLSDGSPFLSPVMAANALAKADLFIIKINNNYHSIKYDSIDGIFYIDTDYRIESNTDQIKYWINGEDSEYSTKIELGNHTKQNKPPVYEIYRLNFTEISDFDNTIKETKFAGYEYEDKDNSDGIYVSSEGKFYPNDHNTNSFEADLITDNPVSSEYIATDEYFAFGKDNKLTQLWRKNPTLCKWGYAGSISHNDYPYRANNQISNIDEYNRAPNPKILELRRINGNLDYFYTHGLPLANYTNHSLHISESFFDYSKYLASTHDYFSYVFEAPINTSDGVNTHTRNTYKYGIFNGGNEEEAASCVFRGAKFKIYDVSNILKDGDDIKQFSLVENKRYNDYKFSIIFGSKRFDSSNSFVSFSGGEPNIGESGVDVYVNHKYKNILVHIYVNSNTNLSDVYALERDFLYSTNAITSANTLTTESLMFSNVLNMLNSVNTKRGFDNFLTYWVIEEDGSFDFSQINNKIAYNSQNLPPFYLAAEYPDEFSVNLESLKIEAIEGPNIKTNQPLLYPEGRQPLGRKFIYNKTEEQPKNLDSRGIYPTTVNINRFRGQYMPIFRTIEMFEAHDGTISKPYGNYKFNMNLSDFALNKEQKMSKVNRFNNILKLKDERNIPSLYPMIDEFGYFLRDMFIFKSTWDDEYYLEVVDNTNTATTPLANTKISYLAPEFTYNNIYGTFNMREQKSFFGSKAMDIEDSIIINESSITFNEDSTTGEQNILGSGETLNTDFNFNNLKEVYHTIEQKKLQTSLERDEITKWVINVDIQQLLKDYLYASIKSARTFVDIVNENTRTNSVNLAIENYINFNLSDRYVIDRVDFYVQYFLIEDDPSLKRYDPLYSLNVKQNKISNIGNAQQTTDINITGSIENNNIEIEYTQTKNSLDYKYDYYFDIVFKRA